MASRPPNPDQLRLFPEDEPTTAPRPPGTGGRPPVDLVRSARRRRTYRWSIQNGRVKLEVPNGLLPTDEQRIVAEVAERAFRRLERAALATDAELLRLGRALAHRYLPKAAPLLRSVSWSDRQGRRWGSCSSDTGAIRLSSRLAPLPSYVLEAVLMHELAHLLEPNHSPAFHALADSYPMAERARGFLEAIDQGLLAGEDDGPWAFD